MEPKRLRYTKDHEWVGRDGDTYVVGITDYAQEQLGDVTYVELPEVGRRVAAEEETAVVESVKAASDVFAPVAGTVASVNEALETQPELVNQDPYGEGWFFKLRDVKAADVEGLMDATDYNAFLATLEE
ncbi:MAG TPA: glycine cleavage system protein GcvH [Candidatus Hydrogenedentes bacterium]|nr:glycine cleavage system protein GcvH [Candidatus Hydrogenedentota bacterium]HNT89871.1 glycine cleavage system protein GcvH [Candidatus Hydrogenedentota bacterium]